MRTHEKLAFLAVLTGLVSSPVYAQDLRSASESVVACQNVEDAAQRLACFEAAAEQLSTALAIPPAQIVPAPTATSSAAAVTAPVQQEATTTTAPVQQASTDTAQPPNNDSILPSWIPRVSFGSGRDVEKEPDEFQTTLTRIQRNNLGRHFFTTAEGHVWRQVEVEDIKAPKSLPADVVLQQNLLGGIEIKILETNRSYGVARIE
nr:hypothetical protein [Hyphomonas sp. Mor2]